MCDPLLEGRGKMHEALDRLVLVRAAVFTIFWEVADENVVRTHEVVTLKPGMRIFRDLIKENDYGETLIDFKRFYSDANGPRLDGRYLTRIQSPENFARRSAVQFVHCVSDALTQIVRHSLILPRFRIIRVGVVEDFVYAYLIRVPIRVLIHPERCEA